MARILGEERQYPGGSGPGSPVRWSPCITGGPPPRSGWPTSSRPSAWRAASGGSAWGRPGSSSGWRFSPGFAAGDFLVEEGGRPDAPGPGPASGLEGAVSARPRTWCRIWPSRCLKACGWLSRGEAGMGLKEAPGPAGRLADWPLDTGTRGSGRRSAVRAGGAAPLPHGDRGLCGLGLRRRARSSCGPEAISPWTWHLVFLYRLSRAGYPFTGQRSEPGDLAAAWGRCAGSWKDTQRGQHGHEHE